MTSWSTCDFVRRRCSLGLIPCNLALMRDSQQGWRITDLGGFIAKTILDHERIGPETLPSCTLRFCSYAISQLSYFVGQSCPTIVAGRIGPLSEHHHLFNVC